MRRLTSVPKFLLPLFACFFLTFVSCKDKPEQKQDMEVAQTQVADTVFFNLSLAQWSLHRQIWDGMDPYNFAAEAKGMGFSGLEYVSQLYKDLEEAGYSEAAMKQFVDRCNEEAAKHGVRNVLIMVDGHGDLAVSDAAKREEAVNNHHKWVDAAAAMGCHAIRVNLSGSSEPEAWVANSVDGLRKLGEYAAGKQINVLVENHGGLSSDASMLARVMNEVGMNNVGTLPDFGNFCIRKEDPSDWGSDCAESYNAYKGVAELMPYAKAVSAKSYEFDADGNETKIDYVRMLQLVRESGYSGFIGVEYEGDRLDEKAGIRATRELLLDAAQEL